MVQTALQRVVKFSSPCALFGMLPTHAHPMHLDGAFLLQPRSMENLQKVARASSDANHCDDRGRAKLGWGPKLGNPKLRRASSFMGKRRHALQSLRLQRSQAEPSQIKPAASLPRSIGPHIVGVCATPNAAGTWAHGVVVSHPLSMREALGSIPSVSICGSPACLWRHHPGPQAAQIPFPFLFHFPATSSLFNWA